MGSIKELNSVGFLLDFLGGNSKKMNTNHHDFNHNDDDTKGWKVRPSKIARNTKNHIRNIVENLNLQPNPDKSVIALSIGDPCIYGNLKCPQEVTDAMIETLTSYKYNGYAPCAGHNEVREEMAKYLSSKNAKYESSDILLFSGCSSAIENAVAVLAEPTEGHNILLPRPGFPMYITMCEGTGIKIKFYDLVAHKNWSVDLNSLENQIDEKTVAIVVNNPSNPCGSVYSAEHLLDILNIASQHKIPIIADEIYEHLVFPGEEFVSLASLGTDVPMLICGGLAKRFLIPGWRVGWVVVHDPVGAFDYGIREGLGSLTTRIIGCNTIVQGAMAKFINHIPQSYYDDLNNTLYEHAKLCYSIISEIPGLNPIMPKGAMYMMVGIEKEHFPDLPTTNDFVRQLMEEESVFCLPGECFQIAYYMRIVVTAPIDILREATTRMAEFAARHYR